MTTWRRALAVTTLLATVVLAPAAPGQAQEQPPLPAPPAPEDQIVQSWALFPTGSDDPDQPSNRPNLSYEVPAGETIEDSVTVANYGSVPLTLRIYASDAFNNPEGGFDVLSGDEVPTGAGSWVSVLTEFVTVPAGTQSIVPITITVPIDASPGDHVGAVLASLRVPGTAPDGNTVTLDQRTGTRLYMRVDGPLNPELAVENLQTDYNPTANPLSGSADVSYRIVNRGNVRLQGTQQLSVGGPFGIGRTTLPAEDIPELLPGEGYDVTATVEGVPATVAAFTEVTLTPEALGPDVGELSESKGTSISLALPVTVLAILLALGLAWYARRAYLRHRREGTPPSGPPRGDTLPPAPATPPTPVGQSS